MSFQFLQDAYIKNEYEVLQRLWMCFLKQNFKQSENCEVNQSCEIKSQAFPRMLFGKPTAL